MRTARRRRDGLRIPLGDLLQRLILEHLIGDDPLQLDVLRLQLLQPLDVVGLHPAELGAPAVIRRLRDLQTLPDLRQLHPLAQQPVGLPQLADDLLRGMPASRHAIAPPTHSPESTNLS
jgi:hypothetical protein